MVRVMLVAPTNGAFVTVDRLPVFGKVDPRGAVVVVSGKRAQTADGSFRRWISLRRGINDIRVVATARGYVRAIINLRIRSDPGASAASGAIAVQDAAFVAKVDNVCASGQREIARLHTPFPPQEFLAVGSKWLREFEAITPPRDKAAAYVALLSIVRYQEELTRQWVALWVVHQFTRARQLAHETVVLEQQLNADASALGVYDCVTPIPSGG